MGLEKLSDGELLKLGLNGKKNEAFSVLYKKYFWMIYGYSVKLSHDSEFSKDLTQNVFCKVFSKLDSFKLEGKNGFMNFLFKITQNEYLNYYRRNSKFFGGYIEKNFKETNLLIQPSSEEDFLREERDFFVRDKIDNLKYLDKEIIKLRYFNKGSYKEIAKELDISEGTVRSRLFVLRKHLKKEFLNKKYLFFD